VAGTTEDGDPGLAERPCPERDEGAGDGVELIFERLEFAAGGPDGRGIEDPGEMCTAIDLLERGLAGEEALVDAELIAAPGDTALLVAEDVIEAEEGHVSSVGVHLEGKATVGPGEKAMRVQHKSLGAQFGGEERAGEAAHVSQKRFGGHVGACMEAAEDAAKGTFRVTAMFNDEGSIDCGDNRRAEGCEFGGERQGRDDLRTEGDDVRSAWAAFDEADARGAVGRPREIEAGKELHDPSLAPWRATEPKGGARGVSGWPREGRCVHNRDGGTRCSSSCHR
jgi:hypothetical protein